MKTVIRTKHTTEYTCVVGCTVTVQPGNLDQINVLIETDTHTYTLPLEPADALELAGALEHYVQMNGGVL